MSFILIPTIGDELEINAWNWRPTLELLLTAQVITEEEHKLMGANGCGGKVGADKAFAIADVVEQKLKSMNPGERMLADLEVTKKPKKFAVFGSGTDPDDIDVNELYSTTYEWLNTFAKFCRTSGGFQVV